MITTQTDDYGLLKVLDNGKYVGFVEENTLCMFGEDGYAQTTRWVILERSDIEPAVRGWYREQEYNVTVEPRGEADRLIGILMAHLVIHEPDAQCVHEAKRYLTQRSK